MISYIAIFTSTFLSFCNRFLSKLSDYRLFSSVEQNNEDRKARENNLVIGSPELLNPNALLQNMKCS